MSSMHVEGRGGRDGRSSSILRVVPLALVPTLPPCLYACLSMSLSMSLCQITHNPPPPLFSFTHPGLFPVDADQFEVLRDSLGKLKLNDAAIAYEVRTELSLGLAFEPGLGGLFGVPFKAWEEAGAKMLADLHFMHFTRCGWA